MDLPRPLSHSSISLYNECPQKYKFKYVDKIPEKPRHFFSFGQSVHSALEFFYDGRESAPTLEALLQVYRERWVSAGYKDATQEAEYYEEGRGILTRFRAKHAPDFTRPYLVEYAFSFEVDGVPVTGRIDRVDKQADGRLAVLDYKTGKRLAAGRLESDDQLTFYQLACERELGAEVSELAFYHVPTLKEHRIVRRPEAQVADLRGRVVSTAESIRKENFEPRPGETKCRWCDYKPLCPVFKDRFVLPAAALSAEDPELAALVDRYGETLAKAEDARLQAERAGRDLAAALERRGSTRALGERFEVAAATAARWEFLDKKKVLELLKSAGAYERVLAPSAPLVHKLLEDPQTDPDLRARLAELGERVESPELKLRPL